LHELGHAMGLKHPHEGATTLPLAYDNTRYSVMSYKSAIDQMAYTFYRTTDPRDSNTGWNRKIEFAQSETLGVYDVLALQRIYGANPNTNAGDTVYAWDQAKSFFATIYDAGGVDTMDLSAHTRGSIVDLTPGAFSSIAYFSAEAQRAYWKQQIPEASEGIDRSYNDPYFATYGYTWKDNVGIAYGTVIENVAGSSGGDTISGNSANNTIWGAGGDDRVLGGAGDDTLHGGTGRNFLRGELGDDSLVGGDDFDDLHGNQGDDTLSAGRGDDWVVGGQGSDLLRGEAGADLVHGNMGDDWCEGGDGDDWIWGGQHNDQLLGQGGDDWLSGDRGDDTVSGGAGADTFYIFADAGLDRVTDFNRAEGDRVQIAQGVHYVVSQIGADVIVELQGAKLVLIGVDQASLGDGWLITA